MMTGDFPPSSRVTGVRFAAAACMTLRPISVPPVNIMWSKARLEKLTAASISPVITVTYSSMKAPSMMSFTTSAVRGVISGGLIMA